MDTKSDSGASIDSGDDKILNGGESPAPGSYPIEVPAIVGDGGSLKDKAKEFHKAASFGGY